MACKLRLATKFNTVPRIMLALKEKYSFSFWTPSPFPHPWQKNPNTHIQNPKNPTSPGTHRNRQYRKSKQSLQLCSPGAWGLKEDKTSG